MEVTAGARPGDPVVVASEADVGADDYSPAVSAAFALCDAVETIRAGEVARVVVTCDDSRVGCCAVVVSAEPRTR